MPKHAPRKYDTNARFTSPIWKLVIIDPEDSGYVICQVEGCKPGDRRIKRGGTTGELRGYNTSNARRHLKTKHSKQWTEAIQVHKEEKDKKEALAMERSVFTFFTAKGTKKSRNDVAAAMQTDSDDPDDPISINCGSQVTSGTSTMNYIQPTLQEHATHSKAWDISHPDSMKITFLIGEMIVRDNEPFKLAARPGFKRLMAHCKPRYTIPDPSYFSRVIIPCIFKTVKASIQTMVTKCAYITFTSDGWKAQNQDNFLSLTAHCVFPTFAQQACVLHIRPFQTSHTSKNISEIIQDMIKEYSIPKYKIHQIVHDNASNMLCGIGKMTEYDSLSCFIHTTQLAINDSVLTQISVTNLLAKIKSMQAHLSRSSTSAESLRQIQIRLNKSTLKMKTDVCTRWDSKYLVFERAHNMKEELSLLQSEVGIGDGIYGQEWVLLEKVVSLLKIFSDITAEMSERYANASLIIPSIALLIHHCTCNESRSDLRGLITTMNELKKGFENRFGPYVMNENLIIATFVDPR